MASVLGRESFSIPGLHRLHPSRGEFETCSTVVGYTPAIHAAPGKDPTGKDRAFMHPVTSRRARTGEVEQIQGGRQGDRSVRLGHLDTVLLSSGSVS